MKEEFKQSFTEIKASLSITTFNCELRTGEVCEEEHPSLNKFQSGIFINSQLIYPSYNFYIVLFACILPNLMEYIIITYLNKETYSRDLSTLIMLLSNIYS